MSLHKLAEVTITVYGLPEHCGTDEQLQELTEGAETLVESLDYKQALHQMVTHKFPELADKIQITTTGQQQ